MEIGFASKQEEKKGINRVKAVTLIKSFPLTEYEGYSMDNKINSWIMEQHQEDDSFELVDIEITKSNMILLYRVERRFEY